MGKCEQIAKTVIRQKEKKRNLTETTWKFESNCSNGPNDALTLQDGRRAGGRAKGARQKFCHARTQRERSNNKS